VSERRTGDREFIAFVSMAMAATALSIDLMLPAFGAIRRALGLAPDSTAVSALVTTFMLGLASMQLAYGVLADRLGRRRVLRMGWALYAAGALATALAPSLPVMLVARFVWGAGAAGPRTTAMAMIRDRTSGERMARQMSFVMAIFLLVPIIAPSLGNAILHVSSWRWVFGFCVLFAAIQLLWSLRLEETLPAERRVQRSGREVLSSIGFVLRTPGTFGYLVAVTALFGAFNAYLAGSQLITDEVFGHGDQFPLIFGMFGVAMGLGVLINGRIVERVGLDRLNGRVMVAYLGISLALLALSVARDGRPPFVLFAIGLAPVLAIHNVLNPNLNSAAMRPLGAMAGTGAAVLGTISMGFGALIGAVLDHAYDGGVTPLCIGFFAAGAITFVAVRAAHASVGSGQRAVVETTRSSTTAS